MFVVYLLVCCLFVWGLFVVVVVVFWGVCCLFVIVVFVCFFLLLFLLFCLFGIFISRYRLLKMKIRVKQLTSYVSEHSATSGLCSAGIY